MPYQRLSGQVVKAEIVNSHHQFFDYATNRFVMEDKPVANIFVLLEDENRIFVTIPPEESGAWMGKRVNVVITTKGDR